MSFPYGFVALEGAALLALGALFPAGPTCRIGTIIPEIVVEEDYNDDLRITDHPVEQGAAITDHSYKEPARLKMTAAWSPGLSTIFNAQYVNDVYDRLLILQNSRVPFSVQAGRRYYTNMLMRSLNTKRDQKTNNILLVQAFCRQIIIVNTQVVTVPPNAVQKDPSVTGATTNRGRQQLQPAPNVNQDALPPAVNGGTP